jgi:dephospho-CoA kinase
MNVTIHIPRLGLTGGIGSGKSTATAYLRDLGAASISADDLVHGLLDRHDITERIADRFGDAVLHEGVVDRPALAQIVFNDDACLDWLEDLLHPEVKRMIGEWARSYESLAPRPPLLVAEIPLLFESGMEGVFDYVLLITAPEPARRKRLAAKLTESQFTRRAERQIDEAEKAARSDFTFDNSASRRHLKEYLGEVYARILAAAGPQAAAGDRDDDA